MVFMHLKKMFDYDATYRRKILKSTLVTVYKKMAKKMKDENFCTYKIIKKSLNYRA